MSQQICPSCATANSTFATVCRSCSVPLEPRVLPIATSDGFKVFGGNGHTPAPAPADGFRVFGGNGHTPAPAPADGFRVFSGDGQTPAPTAAVPPPPPAYEAGPRGAAGEESGWPAHQLTPSRFQTWGGGGWTGLPRSQAPKPGGDDPPAWGPPPAPPRRDSLMSAGPALAPAAAAPAPRAPLAFHLDVGAGSALAPAPGALGSPAASPAGGAPRMPGEADDRGGGRGWGVREQRPAPASAWVPGSVAYGAGGATPGYAYPAAPAAAPPRRWSRTGLQIAILALLVVVATAGVFLTLMRG